MSDSAIQPAANNAKEILVAEFEYIAQTAFQANEDRARVSSYYFVSAGAVIGALLSAGSEQTATVGLYLGFAGLFVVLSLVGSFTLWQLARLRTAWEDSARAMNVIKDYFIVQEPKIAAAFLWRARTIPRKHDWKTVAFLLASSVVLLSAGTATAAGVYIGLALLALSNNPLTLSNGTLIAAGSLVTAVIFAAVESRLYILLVRHARQNQDERAAGHYEKYKSSLTVPSE